MLSLRTNHRLLCDVIRNISQVPPVHSPPSTSIPRHIPLCHLLLQSCTSNPLAMRPSLTTISHRSPTTPCRRPHTRRYRQANQVNIRNLAIPNNLRDPL